MIFRFALALVVVMAVAIKTASAFVWPAGVIAPLAYNAAGATISGLLSSVGVLLGAVGFMVGDQEVVRVRIDEEFPYETPAGWSPGTSPGDAPVPPSTEDQTTLYGWVTAAIPTVHPTQAAACAAGAAAFTGMFCSGPDYFTVSSVVNHVGLCEVNNACISNSTSHCLSGCSGEVTHSGAYSTSASCPSGYTVSGGSCNLTTPEDVRFPADDQCGLTFSGGVMSYDSRDPDCDTIPPQVVLSEDGKTITGTSGGTQIKVKVNEDGSVTVSYTQPSPTSPGTSDKTQVTTTTTGTLVETARKDNVQTVGPTAFDWTPGDPGQGIVFPDDYAREPTQKQIRDFFVTKGDDPADPEVPESLGEGWSWGVFDDLLSWSFPTRGADCPTATFEALDDTFTLDAHCAQIEAHRSLISAVFVLIYAVTAVWVVLEA